MGKTITKEEIHDLPVEEFTGQIVVVQTVEDAELAVNVLLQSTRIGFDTETRPSFCKGILKRVALIQLSTHEICFLFRLNYIGFPPSLIGLLSNPDVQKIGLSLRDDFQSMGRRMKFQPQGFIDLQQMVQNFDIEELSLQKIYAILYRKKISKSQRLSNWEAEQLTLSQQKYAALDAWACLKIYEDLCLTKKSI
ncbi:MAG: Ribonuclease D [Candidatus Ordinivivax streblomastigis]|uniref:3'-5' exonuclease n=1 Tax=Candidatus Ordinivivax streblomastigis TaxID=2540710 RepID=A0A5M8P582_9BACT|nr:MAG: Ribonuclease D [Candidatus Ordinivivax streblomastigis]